MEFRAYFWHQDAEDQRAGASGRRGRGDSECRESECSADGNRLLMMERTGHGDMDESI